MEQTSFTVTNHGPADLNLIVPGTGHVDIAVGAEQTFTVEVGKMVGVTGNLAGGPGEPGD